MRTSDGGSTKNTLYRLVVWLLGSIVFLAIISTVVLQLANKQPPESLTNLAFGAVGGLSGIVSSKGFDEENDAFTAIGEAATKNMIDEILKRQHP